MSWKPADWNTFPLVVALHLAASLVPVAATAQEEAGGPSRDGAALDAYVEFLDRGHEDPVDYILGLFETHDLVVLCERAHPEATQYELFLDAMRDPRFTESVGRVFTEVGLRNLQPALDELMATPGLDEKAFRERLLPLYRDVSFHPVWNRVNFFDFLGSVYRWNQSLEPSRRVEVVFPDLALPWAATDRTAYEAFRRDVLPERDRLIAERIVASVRELQVAGAPRSKALVIMNYRHAFNDFRFDDGERGDNVGRYLFEAFPRRVANVMLNSLAIRPGSTDEEVIFAPVRDGRWDAAFRKAGLSTVGFDLEASPFGKDPFDYFPFRTRTVTYEDVFTDLVFYRHLPEHVFLDGVPGLVDDAFLQELRRRFEVVGGEIADEELAELAAQVEEASTYDGLDELEATVRRWLDGGE
jgi:hypothetical protein